MLHGSTHDPSHLGLAHLSFLEVTVSLVNQQCVEGVDMKNMGELHEKKNLGKGGRTRTNEYFGIFWRCWMNLIELRETKHVDRSEIWRLLLTAKWKIWPKNVGSLPTRAGDVFCFEQSWLDQNHLRVMLLFQVFPKTLLIWWWWMKRRNSCTNG